MAKYKVLYLEYDGLTDPLGQSQVLPYLKGISSELQLKTTIASVEKKANYQEHKAAILQLCKEYGIEWHPITYTKKPPILSILYDLARMYRLVLKLYANNKFDVVHCRSYVTSIIGLKLKEKFKTKFILICVVFFR
jgi:hypothetical protein